MSQEPQPIERGSSCLRLRAPPERRFLTNPELDPLGLAEEIYFARTGLRDYKDVLGRQEVPHVAKGRLYEHDSHPFLHVITEQNRYNDLIEYIQLNSKTPDLYKLCRHRWFSNLGIKRATRPCMRPFCPACWMLKVERAYEALADTRAPVIGVMATRGLTLTPDLGEALTAKALGSVISPAHQLWIGKRDKAWHPLFWALFPCPGTPMPSYKVVAIHVAQEAPAIPAGVDPEDAAVNGVPRILETTSEFPATVYEYAFTGEHRSDQAWDRFRRETLAPVITSSVDNPLRPYPDEDGVRTDPEVIRIPRLTRTATENQTRFASGAPVDLGILNPCLDPGSFDYLYGDLREAREHYLRETKDCKERDSQAAIIRSLYT